MCSRGVLRNNFKNEETKKNFGLAHSGVVLVEERVPWFLDLVYFVGGFDFVVLI